MLCPWRSCSAAGPPSTWRESEWGCCVCFVCARHALYARCVVYFLWGVLIVWFVWARIDTVSVDLVFHCTAGPPSTCRDSGWSGCVWFAWFVCAGRDLYARCVIHLSGLACESRMRSICGIHYYAWLCMSGDKLGMTYSSIKRNPKNVAVHTVYQ